MTHRHWLPNALSEESRELQHDARLIQGTSETAHTLTADGARQNQPDVLHSICSADKEDLSSNEDLNSGGITRDPVLWMLS
jgi:hypothetical protein